MGRIEALGPGLFRVVVAAVPYRAVLAIEPRDAASFVCASVAEARAKMEEELDRCRERVRSQGGAVVEVRREERDPFDEDRRLR
jgi:hypothetical protein